MKSLIARDRILIGQTSNRPRRLRVLGLAVALFLGALFLLFLAWPYATLWQIDKAVRDRNMAELASLVDLESVRMEIKKKLNKNANSTIGDMSDPFIRWLEEGIADMGNQAVERLVTLSWVQGLLLERGTGDKGFLGQVTYAFFNAPDGFTVRIGPASGTPVRLRLSLHDLDWRISAVYY